MYKYTHEDDIQFIAKRAAQDSVPDNDRKLFKRLDYIESDLE